MLAERESGAGPRRIHALRVALALVVGAAGAALATPPAAAVDGAPVRLSVIVPVVVPPEKTGLIDADALARYTSPLGVLTRQLDAVVGHDVTLAIDPRIIASVRALGAQAPPTAAAWLRRLEAMPHESFLLPYANADVALATQAGAASVPQPISLEFAIDAEAFPAPEPSPSATADPVPPVPTTQSLLAWPSDHPGLLWPSEGAVVAGDLAVFAASGFDAVLLRSDSVAGRAGPLATIDELDAVVADDATSTALRDAVGGAAGTTQLIAAVHAAADRQADAGVVATLERAIPLSDTLLPAALDALDGDAGIDLVPLSHVRAATATPETLVDRPHTPEAIATARALVQADARVTEFADITADPELLSGQRRLALLAALDQGWSGNPAGWELAAGEYAERTDETLAAVQIVTGSDVNFFTDRSSIQVPVRNDLDQAVTVYLTVTASRPLLDVEDDRVEVTIEPNSVRNAPVPVQSISNGTVRLTMTLVGADGEQIGDTAGLTVNVQAGWEGPVVIALGAVVVVVFAAGLARNIVRRRRERA